MGLLFRCLKTRKVLAIYCFLVRAHYHDQTTWTAINATSSLLHLHIQFYELCEELFGQFAVSYNGHNFLHLPESVKRTGPLWLTSAERFEDLYGVCKKFYHAGTENTPKQVLENSLFHASVKHHCAFQRTLKIAEAETEKNNNTLLWSNGRVFKVIECLENKQVARERRTPVERMGGKKFLCKEMTFSKVSTHFLDLNLPWSKVGIYKAGEEKDQEPVTVERSQVQGKIVRVKKFFITCLKEWI